MARTKLFISYSHRDGEWLERLKLHLAILERQGLVHVWSDTRISLGARWQDEIEIALGDSRAAVLLVSPGFLASEFIWNDEMPRIMAHEKEGMVVLPLIARPCAWRVAPELAELQARPLDGSPLSLGSDAEIDRDLAELTYELAGRLELLTGAMASNETNLMRENRRRTSIRSAVRGRLEQSRRPGYSVVDAAETLLQSGQSWTGLYDATARQLRLVVGERQGPRLQGSMEYLDEGSSTRVEGRTVEPSVLLTDPALNGIILTVSEDDAGVIFKETGAAREGVRSTGLSGEYRAVITGRLMRGAWVANGQAMGKFELRLDE